MCSGKANRGESSCVARLPVRCSSAPDLCVTVAEYWIKALKKDKLALQARVDKTDTLLTSIGGQFREGEAKTLILRKLYDLVNQELNRYLNAEKRKLIQLVESLWDQYAASSRTLESERVETTTSSTGFVGTGVFGMIADWKSVFLGDVCDCGGGNGFPGFTRMC